MKYMYMEGIRMGRFIKASCLIGIAIILTCIIAILFAPDIFGARSSRRPPSVDSAVAAAGDVGSPVGDFVVPDNTTLINADATTGNMTVTLPDAATVANVTYKVVKVDVTTNTVTVVVTGGDAIAGASSYVLRKQYDVLDTVSNGTSYTASVPMNAVIDVRLFGAIASDGIDDKAAILLAMTQVGDGVLRFVEGEYTIGSNLVFTSRVEVFEGASLAPDVGVALTFEEAIEAGAYEIFGDNGSVVWDPVNVARVNVAWFVGDPTDATGAFQEAFDAGIDIEIVIGPDAYALLTDITFDDSVTIAPGTIIDVDDSATLTIDAPIDIPNLPVFLDAVDDPTDGTVIFNDGSTDVVLPVWFGAGVDVADNAAAIEAAVAAGNTNIKSIRLPAGVYNILSDVDIQETLLDMGAGAVIDIGVGNTLTIGSGVVNAGIYQIFSGDGDVSLDAGSCEYVLPQWWGAIGDNSTDCYAAFRAAIDSLNGGPGKMYIPAGTYKISATLDDFPTGSIAASNTGIVIEGAGSGETILKYTGLSGYLFSLENDEANSGNSPTKCIIRDLHIQATDLTSTGGGIEVSHSGFNQVEGVVFTGIEATYGQAINLRNQTKTVSESGFTNDTNRDFTTTGAGATERYAIKFSNTSNVAARIKSVTVRLGKTGAPAGTIAAWIYSDSAGSPDAALSTASASVTNTNLSADADGADVTFEWVNYADRGSLATGVAGQVVLITTGYTYTDTTTEVRLRVDAGDGDVNEFGTFDTGGGGWSTSNDGSNNTIILRTAYGPLGAVFDNIHVYGSPRALIGINMEDAAQLKITNSNIYATLALQANFNGTLDAVTTQFSSSGTNSIEITGGITSFSTGYIESGPVVLDGGFHSFTQTQIAAYVNSSDPTRVSINGSPFAYFQGDNVELRNDFWGNKVYPVNSTPPVALDAEMTLAADGDALTGMAGETTTNGKGLGVWWILGMNAMLPRGTYLITVWAKTDATANLITLVSIQRNISGGNTQLAALAFPTTTTYQPYRIFHNVEAGDSTTYGSWVQIYKSSANANKISVSHVTVERVSEDSYFSGNPVLFSQDNTDGDGARESELFFVGRQSGDEQHALASIKVVHDGAVDDRKGRLEIYVNEDTSWLPTKLAAYWDSLGDTYLTGDVNVTGTLAATTVTGANVTSGADPGHTHTGGGVTDHGALTGLDPDDDHTQYVLVDGTREMTGNLSLDKDSADIKVIATVYDDDATELPSVDFRKADGTEGAPALVDDNDVLGVVSFQGHDGSGFHEGARIEGRIDGTPSDGTDMPTELTIWTTPEASATAVQRAIFTAGGSIGLLADDPAGDVDIGGANVTALSMLTGNNRISLAVGGDSIGLVYVEGSAYAQLVLDDSGGSSNQQIVMLNNTDGVTGFDIINDDGTVRVADVIAFENASGEVGFLTDAPLGNVDIGGVNPTIGVLLTAADIGSVAVGGSTGGRAYIEGSGYAQLILDDSGGAADEQIVTLTNTEGVTNFQVIDDIGGVAVADVIIFDNTNGNVAFGITPDASVKTTIRNAGDQLKLEFDGTDNTVISTDTNGDLTITPSGVDVILAKGVVSLIETTTPGADAGYGKIYTKSDDDLYFQDGSGNEHTILKGSTSIQHEYFAPLEEPTGTVGNWDIVAIGTSQAVHFTFQIPEDFEVLDAITVVVLPDATETIQWDIFVSVAAVGEAYNNDDRSALNETLAVTVNLITELDISGVLTGLAAGDYIAIDFQSDIANIQVVGLEFDFN
ncbi:hypothetical protein LCGC14_0578330 [marine sediment metagenome]|uniref:Pectate lyase superfamily protein domain-containing protein n=1 Tax=marine sediment metagenome TaxID=412755 RepID=A0A0F9S0T8_9ZZZZ